MEIRSEDIYQTLFDDDAFARLPHLLAEAGNGRSALFLWQHNDRSVQITAHSYLPQSWIDGYAAKYSAVDPYLDAALRPHNTNRVILANDYCPPDVFERSVIYNELIREQDDDTVHCIGSAFTSAWGSGIVGIHNGRRAPPFDAGNAHRLESVLVHAERVLRVRGELASAQRATQFNRNALDAIGLAAITVRADGYILQHNAVAQAILQRADGLLSVKGHLSCKRTIDMSKLAAAVGRATASANPAAGASIVERGPDEPAYLVTITPLVGTAAGATALLLFRDPAREDASLTERLRLLFGLSNAEAAVAIDLANGLTLADVSRNRGVQISTLRAQLRSIGLKTGCGRQAALIALMRRLPPLAATH